MPGEEELLEHLEALQAQSRAAMRVLKTTNQLLAQALVLLRQARTAKEAQRNEHSRDTVRVG